MLGGQGVWYPAPVLPLGLVPPPPPPPPILEFATFEAHNDSDAAASEPHSINNNGMEEVEGLPPEIIPALSVHRNVAIEFEDTAREVEVGTGRAPREQRRAVLRAELKDRIGVDKERSVLWQ